MPIDLYLEIDDDYEDHVDEATIRAVVDATFAHLKITDAELTVVITGDDEVQTLNREYRDVDAPTDVLSFATRDGNRDGSVEDAGIPAELRAEMARALGDVIIAFPYARRQALQYGNTPADEILLLVTHGVLHLLGHDHTTVEEEADMWILQEAILEPFGVEGLSGRDYEE